MELSAIINHYNVPLTRAERTLVSSLKSGSTSRTDDYSEQQLENLADSRALLKSLPDRKNTDQQNKAEKIRMLKERLKMLKQMIPFMSPSAAKALKAELKQIASQMASLKAEGGVSAAVGREGGVPMAAQADTTEVATSGEETTAAATDGDINPEDQEQATPDTPSVSPDADQDREHAAKSRAEHEQERALNEAVEDLKRLYRTVRAMVQRKLQQVGDKGEPVAGLPTQMQAFLTPPDSGTSLTIKV